MIERVSKQRVICLVAAAIAWASVAQAYVGPGSGLSAIGALLAMIGAIGFAILGLIWYPFKRLLHFIRSRRDRNRDGKED